MDSAITSDLSVNATTQPTSWFGSVLNDISKAATSYLTLEQQKELNAINLQRAQQGLPALDASQYGLGVSVGVSQSTQNTLLLIAGGVVLAIVASSFLRKR